MRAIRIEIDNRDMVSVYFDGLFADQDPANILIESYLAEARNLVKNHNCENPNCHVTKIHTKMIMAIEKLASEHKHDEEEH